MFVRAAFGRQTAGSNSAVPRVPWHVCDVEIDYTASMQANLQRVFNERDVAKRNAAIDELFTETATLYEPEGIAIGRAAISAAVTALHAALPPSFVFVARGPAVGHHGVGRLHWTAGPPGGPVGATGTDVAQFEGSRIHALYVFLDPA